MKGNLTQNTICNFSRLGKKMKDNKKSNSSKRIKLFNKKFLWRHFSVGFITNVVPCS